MTHVFQSVTSTERTLSIEPAGVGTQKIMLAIKDMGQLTSAFIAHPGAEAYIANAILAEAGIEAEYAPYAEHGTPQHLAHIRWNLNSYEKAQRRNSEAEAERAALEAEALQFFNVYYGMNVKSWENANTTLHEKENFIAIAEASRKIRAAGK